MAGVLPTVAGHRLAMDVEPVEVGLLVPGRIVVRLTGEELLAQPDHALGAAQHGCDSGVLVQSIQVIGLSWQ